MSLTEKTLYAPQPSTLRSHPTPLSVSPDGTKLAYASGTSVFLREIDDPSKAKQYTGHTTSTTVARFSPSGYYVASGDISGLVRVWDAVGEDNILKGEYPVVSGRINDLAWDGDSQRIIAVGEGKERFGHCISYDSGNTVGEIQGHSGPINAVAIKAQRPYRALTVSDDATAAFFHGPPFKYNTSLKDHGNFVLGAQFSPDGAVAVTVGSDRKIFVYDGKTGGLLREIKDETEGHKGSIFAVSFSPDSKSFVTSSADQTVKLWDLESGKVKQTWKFGEKVAPGYQQVGVVYTPRKDNLIIALSLHGDLSYLVPGKEAPIQTVVGHQKALTAANLDVSGNKLYTGSYDGEIRVWDLETGLAAPVDGEGHSNQVIAIEQGQHGRLITVGWDDTIRTIDSATQAFVGDALKTEEQPKAFTAAPDGTFFLITPNTLQHISASIQRIANFSLSKVPTSISASTAGLVLGLENNSLQVYHIPLPSSLPSPQKTLTPHRSQPIHLAFSPDGKYLSSADTSGKIVLLAASDYSVATSRWAFHSGKVNSVRWDASSKYVITGGVDGNIFVYSVDKAGKKLLAKGAHRGGVSSVVWRSETEAVSVGQDGAVRRWAVEKF